MKAGGRKTQLARTVRRALLLGLLWWALADGLLAQWWLGVAVVVVATVVMNVLGRDAPPQPPVRLHAVLKTVPYFFYYSFVGGIQVARAAFAWRRAVQPYFARFPLRLGTKDDLARTVFAATTCLLPGTVSCRIEDDDVVMHVLDEGMFDERALRCFEGLIADIFGAVLAKEEAPS